MRAFLRARRGPLLLVAALVLVLLGSVLLTGPRAVGTLDPDGFDPAGSRALAMLLEQRGVDVVRTTDAPSTRQVGDGGGAVLVPMPELLSEDELALLAATPGPLVVVGATPRELAALDLEDVEAVALDDAEERLPRCSDEVAVNAGEALTGGVAYRADGCYGTGDSASLVRRGDVTLLGAGDVLTNEHLGEAGNAALAIGLLSGADRLAWLVPSPQRTVLGERPVISPDDLLADWVVSARTYLLVVLVVLALWRGRRLGRVVLEQLPVVVRAAETVEGHGRLYRAAGARDRAAEELRAARRRLLARLVHDGTATPDALVELVAGRTGREPVAVRALLYGPTPADDAALVRLARDLDALAREALTREGATS